MPLTLTTNISNKFHNINDNLSVKNYVNGQMGLLEPTIVGEKVLRVFRLEAGATSRLFGKDSDLARADVTRSGDSVLIQIQNNRTRPSHTYASLTVDVSVHEYLSLAGPPPKALSPLQWDIANIDRMSKKDKKDLVERINASIGIFNRTQIAALNAGVEVPPTLECVTIDTLVNRAQYIQQCYNNLRLAVNNYRNDELNVRQTDVGRNVIQGLNQSLNSVWKQDQVSRSGVGTKISVKLSFT